MNEKQFEEIKNMVEHCTTLEQLYNLWKEAHQIEKKESWINTCSRKRDNNRLIKPFCHINYQNFITDMIGRNYSNQDIKVVYILREANINKSDVEQSIEFNPEKHWIQSTHDRAVFYRRWMENIYNTEVKKVCPSITGFNINNVAYINLNKRGGFDSCDHTNLKNYIKTYSAFINKEISIINPDIIICCGTYGHVTKLIVHMGNLKIFDCYHPSARKTNVCKQVL